MRYFANPCTDDAIAAMAAGHLGMIDTPLQAKVYRVEQAHAAGVVWCADNGAFTDRWVEDRWWAWLTAPRQLDARARCAFAVAPDVVGNAAVTLERSAPWLPRIRELGYPAALVAQDGLQRLPVPWGTFDVLFLGGTTDWKLGPHARALTAEAVARGVPVHMGRVNSLKRIRYAGAIGCTSVDGTIVAIAPDRRLPEVLGWVRDALEQHTIPLPVPTPRG